MGEMRHLKEGERYLQVAGTSWEDNIAIGTMILILSKQQFNQMFPEERSSNYDTSVHIQIMNAGYPACACWDGPNMTMFWKEFCCAKHFLG